MRCDRLCFLGATVLLLAAACTGSDDPTPGGVGLTPGATVPPGTPPGSAAPDTFAAIERCFAVPPAEESACLDTFVTEFALANDADTPQLLAEMEAARGVSSALETRCHPIAHAIGRHLYTANRSVPESFEACDESCHSGCYHGVMERVFLPDGSASVHPTLEDVQAKVPTVCAPEQFDDPTPALLFQCYHGIGHAILFTLAYDLELGIETCGLSPSEKHAADCRLGAFMENISAADPALRDLDREDPHYPCTKFEGAISAECYTMQTSVMSEYGLSDEEIVSECQMAAGATEADPSVLQCMVSVGRDLSSNARSGNGERLRVACEDLPATTTQSNRCIWGSVAALIDNSWDGRFAVPFCGLFKEEGLRVSCYDMSRSHLVTTYGFDRPAWFAQCAEHAAEGQLEVCEAAFPETMTP